MDHLREPDSLTLDELEHIEKQSLRCLFQATVDFGFDAFEIFYQSPDDVNDVAEDITREMLDRFGGYQFPQRILGKVDYRKARYVILPDLSVRQALFVDSKAEKDGRSATMQMSQTSLEIKYKDERQNLINEQGKLPIILENQYLTTVMLAHYEYQDDNNRHILKKATLAAVPNGKLQERYNPTHDETIWRAGRHAPSRGEAFRVRLGFSALKARAAWRIQTIQYDQTNHRISFQWDNG